MSLRQWYPDFYFLIPLKNSGSYISHNAIKSIFLLDLPHLLNVHIKSIPPVYIRLCVRNLQSLSPSPGNPDDITVTSLGFFFFWPDKDAQKTIMFHRLSRTLVNWLSRVKQVECPFKNKSDFPPCGVFCILKKEHGCATVGNFACSVRKIVFLFRATACLERADKLVFVYTLKISSVGWELNITHIHTYTRSITLTPDARKSSGDWVASTAKPYHAWLSPDFASFSKLAWSHHRSPVKPSARL